MRTDHFWKQWPFCIFINEFLSILVPIQYFSCILWNTSIIPTFLKLQNNINLAQLKPVPVFQQYTSRILLILKNLLRVRQNRHNKYYFRIQILLNIGRVIQLYLMYFEEERSLQSGRVPVSDRQSAPDRPQPDSYSDVPEADMSQQVLLLKSERDQMQVDSLDYLINTYLIKEMVYPDRKFEILSQFCQRFFNLPQHETDNFPKLHNLLREQKLARFSRISMAEVKKLVHPLNIWELSRHLTSAKNSIHQSFRKNLILVVGATAAGKSTFIQSCLGYKHIKTRDEQNRRCLGVEGGLRKEHETLLTSRANQSCTLMINTYEMRSNYISDGNYIGDSAGLGQNRGAQIEIANTVSFQTVVSKSESVRFIFLIHQRNWGDRANSIREYFAQFSSKFKDFQIIKDKIIYVLNGFSNDEITDLNADLRQIMGTRATQQYGERGHRNLKVMIGSLVQLTQQLNEWQEGGVVYSPRLLIYKPESTTLRQIMAKIGSDGLKIYNIAENIQMNFSTNCKNTIKEEVQNLRKRAEASLRSQLYSRAIYYLDLLKKLSQNIRKDQFSVLSFEEAHTSFLESKDEASLAWKKIHQDAIEKARRNGSNLKADFQQFKEMTDTLRDLQIRKDEYQKFKDLVEFIGKIDKDYESQLMEVENSLKESQTALLDKYKNNPSKKTSLFLENYAKVFNPNFLTDIKKALKEEYCQKINDLENYIEYEEFDKLDPIFVKMKRLNELLIDNEDEYKGFLDTLQENIRKIKTSLQIFIDEKISSKTKLSEEPEMQKIKTYCELLNKKMKSEEMLKIVIPILTELVDSFCFVVKKTLNDALGTRNVRNQKRIIIAWNNYEEIKKIENQKVKQITLDIRNSMERFQDMFEEKYAQAPSRKQKQNFDVQKVFEDLEFIATRIKVYRDIYDMTLLGEWQEYFKNALKKIQLYHDNLVKERQLIQNQGTHDLKRINQIHKIFGQLDNNGQDLLPKTSSDETEFVEQFLNKLRSSQSEINQGVIKSMIPQMQKIMEDQELDLVMRMKKMSLKIEGIAKTISSFDDQQTRHQLIQKKKQGEEWIYNNNETNFRNILENIIDWRNSQEITHKNMLKFQKDVNDFRKQNNYAFIRQTMKMKEWDTEETQLRFQEELNITTKRFQEKSKEMIERNQIAEAKNYIQKWKNYLKLEETFPALKISPIFENLRQKIREIVEKQLVPTELNSDQEKIDLEDYQTQLEKARNYNEEEKIKTMTQIVAKHFDRKIVYIKQKLGGLEDYELKGEKIIQQLIKKMIEVNEEVEKFDQIWNQSIQSKKYIQKMDKQNEKLQKILFEEWCCPISELIKNKQYISALENLKKYQVIQSYLEQGKDLLRTVQMNRIMIYDSYKEIVEKNKKEEEDKLSQQDKRHIDWRKYSPQLMKESIKKMEKRVHEIQENLDFENVLQQEEQQQIKNIQIACRKFEPEAARQLKDMLKSLNDKVKLNNDKEIKKIKQHGNDLPWLILKLKDSENMDDEIKNEIKKIFQAQILLRLKYEHFIQKFDDNLQTYFEKNIVCFLEKIKTNGLQLQMKDTLKTIQSTIIINVSTKIQQIIKEILQNVENKNAHRILRFFDSLKGFYCWIGLQKDTFSQEFFNELPKTFKSIHIFLKSYSSMIMKNQGEDEETEQQYSNLGLKTQVFTKIKEILKQANKFPFIKVIIDNYQIDTSQVDKIMKEKGAEISELINILQNFNFSRDDFQKMSKKVKEQQFDKVQRAYEIYMTNPMLNQKQNRKKQKMGKEIERINKQFQSETTFAKQYIGNKLEDIETPSQEKVTVFLQVVNILILKKYSFLRKCDSLCQEIKFTLSSNFQKIKNRWSSLEKDVTAASQRYFEEKKNTDSKVQLQKQKIQSEQEDIKLKKIKKLEEDQKIELKGQEDAHEIDRINTKFQGLIKALVNDCEKEIKRLKEENEQKYSKKRQQQMKPLQLSIVQFVNNCLLQEKIFHQLHFEEEKKKFRQKMRDFGKRQKKRIRQIVYQVAQKSQHTKYSKIFMDQNIIFQSDNHAVWQKKTHHVGIGEVVKNLTGQQKISQIMCQKINENFQTYDIQFSKWTEKYKQNANSQVIRSLTEAIKKDGNTLHDHYFSGKTVPQEVSARLLAKIFALMTILKAQSNDEDCIVTFDYRPHPAQITAVLLLLGTASQNGLNKIQNCLAQVETGEGKSVVLGGLSAYLSVCGYKVFCVCYSSYLSQRDFGDFYELFKELEVDKKVTYGTFQQLAEEKLGEIRRKVEEVLTSSSNQTSIFNKLKQFIQGQWSIQKIQKDQNSILLIDQVDVFFDQNYYGSLYRSAISLSGSLVVQFLKAAWEKKSDYANLPEFKALEQRYVNLAKILREILNELQYELQYFDYQSYRKKYEILDNQIQYRVKDGFNPNITEGLTTMIAYLQENKKGGKITNQIIENMLQISLIVAEFSYAELPKFFSKILGVTGTLKQMSKFKANQLRKSYQVRKNFYIPSVYGDSSKRRKIQRKIVATEKHSDEIATEILNVHRSGRPVLVFFKSQEELMSFYTSSKLSSVQDKIQILDETFDASERNKKIRDTGYENQISLMTDSFGRGTDFKISDKAAQMGGLHVIQTYLSEQLSDEIQVQGRTARQSAKGSYLCLITPNHLELFQLKGKQDGNQINEKLLQQARSKIEEQKEIPINERVIKAKQSHDQTINLFNNDLNMEKLLKKVQELNSFDKGEASKIVLGIDGTGSMYVALTHVLNILKQSLNNLKKLLKESNVKKSFEMKIVIYRNYNSSANMIIQSTKFEKKVQHLQDFLKNIRVDGGWGNQALEMLYDHVNSLQDVKDLIILGDAAANTKDETDWKRNQHKRIHQSSNWVYAQEELQKIRQKKIKVHSFYINTHGEPYFNNTLEPYFKEISKKTNGIAELFDVKSANASRNLSQFMVERIIDSTAENQKQANELKSIYKMRYVQRN